MIRSPMLLRFIKFGFIGVIGLGVDSGILLCGTKIFGLDPYSARVISYICAATATWFGNRMLTFADRPKTRPSKQWVLFLMANAPGMLVNNGLYVLLVSQIPAIHDNPVWAVAAGSLAGMVLNFVAANRFVFPST
jgi:putative flippase GtrA